MALQDPQAEPSMEEILASIRRIISEEEQGRALDIGRFLVIPPERPAEAPGTAKSFVFPDAQPVTREWHSGKEKLMSRQEVVAWPREHNVLAPYLRPGAV